MNARIPVVLGLVLAVIVAVVYVVHNRGEAPAVDAGPALAATSDPREAGPCERLPGSFKLASGMEAGDARIAASELLVPVTFAKGGDRAAAVLAFATETAAPQELTLGPAFSDDPPPRVVVDGASVFAAHVLHETKDRAVRLARRKGAGWEPAFTAAWPAGSLSFDAAARGDAALFAYTDEKPDASFVRLVDMATGKVAASIATTMPDDVELERTADGYLLFWTAGAPDDLPDASDPNEGPGEGRSVRWIESARLDARGVPQGPVQVMSDKKGHAASLSLLPDGTLLFRDDFEPHEGEGTRILRIGPGDGAKAAQVAAGSSRQAFDVVPSKGDGVAVAFVDAEGNSRLVQGGHEEPEPLLDDARVLGVLPSATSPIWVALRAPDAQDRARATSQPDVFFLRCAAPR